MNDLPVSPSVSRNKETIYSILKRYIHPDIEGNLFEIGSGTGEHATFLARAFPLLKWTPSDDLKNHFIIQGHSKIAGAYNILPPIEYMAGHTPPPKEKYDFIFTANTLHIMSWESCKQLLKDIKEISHSKTTVFFYGPFKFEKNFTSESNQEFDFWLKERSALSGIRDFEEVDKLMTSNNFKLLENHNMPANNQLLAYVVNT